MRPAERRSVVAFLLAALLQTVAVSGNFLLEVQVLNFSNTNGDCGLIDLCDPYIDEMCLDAQSEEEEGQECSLAVSTANLDLEDGLPKAGNLSATARPWPVHFRLVIKVMDDDLLDPDDHIEDLVVLESLNTSSEFSEERGYRNTPDGRITLTLRFRVQCTGGYEGPHCDCLLHNDAINGHYTCREDGGISCLPGYTNTSNFCKERGLVCPSNGTCVNASTSHTFQSLLPSGEIVKNASVNGRGESSSILGPVIGAIVASLLVALLLTAVIIIVCIVLRKRRWTCVILFAPPQPAGAHSNTEIPPDTVRFTQNPAYSVHNAHPHSPQRRQGPPEGREGAHSPPSSQRDNFMPQELRLTAEANRQDGGAIHLLMNLAYTTCNESHRDREDQLVPEGGSSPTQRHTAAAQHNEDYIQLLPETANSIASERHPSQERSAQSGPQLQAAPFLPQETQEEMAVYYI